MFVIVAEEAVLFVVGPLPGTPDERAAPHAVEDLVQQQLQLGPVFIVDRNQQHTVFGQQVLGQQQSPVEKLQPLRMPVGVIAAEKPVVVDKILVAGIVGRVDIDALDPAFVSQLQIAQRIEVVAFDNQVAVRRRADRQRLVQFQRDKSFGQRLVMLDLAALPDEAQFALRLPLFQQGNQICFV